MAQLPTSSRRRFLKHAGVGAAAFTIVPRHVLGRGFVAPSDKINLGVIGLGKQGNLLSKFFLQNTEAQIVAGSDVWTAKREAFAKNVAGFYAEQRGVSEYSGVTSHLDYRELIARDDVDAVIVATPDHWHSIQCVDVMKGGKDLYVEKPLTHTIKEGRAIVDAADKYEAVVQVGSMQRSWDRFKKAQEIVSSTQLGEIDHVLVSVGNPPIPYDLPGEVLPEGLDWNRWCGPAPLVAYNSAIAPEVVDSYPPWRDYREFASGRLADWGAHMFDIVQWCLGMDDTGPVLFVPPADPTAVRGLTMQYANGIDVHHEDFGRGNAVRFVGSEGSLDVSRSFLESTPETIVFPTPVEDPGKAFNNKNNHYQDWLTAIKTRGTTICPAEVGHRSATVCNAAAIAYRLNEPLRWNPKREKFVGNRAANRLRSMDVRKWESA